MSGRLVTSWQRRQFRFSIVACARWEHDDICEWLAYHRSIGFDHVYLYCNDDDPAALFERVAPFLGGDQPYVDFMHYPYVGEQREIYLHHLQHFLHESEWYSYLDIDEFLCLRQAPTIGEFLATFPHDCNCIYFNWIFYGHNGYLERPGGSVLRQYTRRQAGLDVHTKHLTRAACVDRALVDTSPFPFWHGWDGRNEASKVAYNAIGERVPNYSVDFPVNAWRYIAKRDAQIQASAYIAHFAIRSEADFRRRAARGTAGNFTTQDSWQQMFESGRHEHYLETVNAVVDDFLKLYWERHLGLPITVLPRVAARREAT